MDSLKVICVINVDRGDLICFFEVGKGCGVGLCATYCDKKF